LLWLYQDTVLLVLKNLQALCHFVGATCTWNWQCACKYLLLAANEQS
jgi:hypothetical protein